MYSAVERTLKKNANVKVYFASPNVTNPEIFLELFGLDSENAFRTKEAPVAQNLFFIDLVEKYVKHYSEFETYTLHPQFLHLASSSLDVIHQLAGDQSNIIYCNSIADTVFYAREFRAFFKDEKKPVFSAEENKQINNVVSAIKELIHEDYFLIDCLEYGIGFHFGSLPQMIRTAVENLFKQGVIKHLFCTSTLVEGVNLPAKNVFILKNKKGLGKISKIDFWNLAGRAGRLNYELSGNIFCIREFVQDWNKLDILEDKENIELQTSVDIKISKQIKKIEKLLQDQELGSGTEKEKEVLRYIANIISIDTLQLKNGYQSPIIQKLIDDNKFEIIELAKKSMESNIVPEGIIEKNQFIFVKQQNKVYEFIQTNLKQGKSPKFPDKVNYDYCLKILNTFFDLYNWEETEKSFAKKEKMTYFAQLMNNWMNGFSLNALINKTIRFKQENGKEIVYFQKGQRIKENFDINNRVHVNHEINRLIDDIEHELRFTLEKYFNNFYLIHSEIVGENSAGINWANYLEYGTRDPNVIALQVMGFSRHTSNYIVKTFPSVLIVEDGKLVNIKKDELLLLLNLTSNESIEHQEIISVLT